MSEQVPPKPTASQQELQSEIARLNKIIQALMNRAERNASVQGSSHSLLQTAITLEDQVRSRTEQLEAALRENEKITRALRESEDRYRAFFLGARIPMLLIDPADGRIVDANAAAEKYYGYTLGQLRAMNIDRINTLTRQQVAEEMSKATVAKKNYFNFRHRLAGGEVRDVEVHSGPVTLQDHNLLYSIVHDVTERKQAEAALHELNRDFVAFLENTTDYIYFKDENSRFRFCSQTLADITGHANWRDMTGKHDLDVFPEDTARIYSEEELSIFRDGRPLLNKIDAYYDARGAKGWVSTNKWPVFDGSGGKVIGLFGISRDITERMNLEQQLREREALFHAIFDQTSVGIELVDPDTLRFAGVNPAACRMLGYTHEELLQMRLPDTQVDLDEAALRTAVLENARSGGLGFENRHRCKNGDILDVEVTAHILDLSGRRMIVVIWRDITAHKRSQQEIEFKNTILQTQQEVSPDAILVVDEYARIISYNRQFVELWKIPQQIVDTHEDAAVLQAVVEQVEDGKAFRDRVHHLYLHRGEKSREEIRMKDGRTLERYSSPAVGADGRYYGRVWYFHDITERKQADAHIRSLAFHDALTRLPNRRLLHDRLKQAMVAGQRSGLFGAVMFLDLDNFKPLNDSHGHDIGDMLLIEVARRIVSCVRAKDTVARFGGDEFVVILCELQADAEQAGKQARSVAEKIRVALAQPYLLMRVAEGGVETMVEHRCTASIGLVLFSKSVNSEEDILKAADTAMYRAKVAGRDKVHFSAQKSYPE